MIIIAFIVRTQTCKLVTGDKTDINIKFFGQHDVVAKLVHIELCTFVE